MGSESEACVDELLAKVTAINNLLTQYESKSEPSEDLTCDAREILSSTQAFIDNNKHIIPAYCMKKASEAVKKLDSCLNRSRGSSTIFKFSSGTSKGVAPNSTPKVEFPAEPTPEVKQPQYIICSSDKACDFSNLADERVNLKPDQVLCKDISLTKMLRCGVKIFGCANTVYIRGLEGCSVTICLASRAITIAHCKNCVFQLVCQQLRIDSASECTFEIYTSSRSMMESSKNLKFECYNLSKSEFAGEQLDSFLTEAKFDPNANNWKCIDDFDWLCPSIPSKNYTISE